MKTKNKMKQIKQIKDLGGNIHLGDGVITFDVENQVYGEHCEDEERIWKEIQNIIPGIDGALQGNPWDEGDMSQIYFKYIFKNMKINTHYICGYLDGTQIGIITESRELREHPDFSTWAKFNTKVEAQNYANLLVDGTEAPGFEYVVEEWEYIMFDVQFNDDTDSDSKGFELTIQECMEYIETFNGTNESYFNDYKGGTVSIVENETGKTIFQTKIK